MSLTMAAMVGIVVGFMCLVVGFFMDHSQMEVGVPLARSRVPVRRGKKRAARTERPHRKAD